MLTLETPAGTFQVEQPALVNDLDLASAGPALIPRTAHAAIATPSASRRRPPANDTSNPRAPRKNISIAPLLSRCALAAAMTLRTYPTDSMVSKPPNAPS
jgi:hypothetical protein